MKDSLLKTLRNEVLPKHYKHDVSDLVGDDCLLFKKGAYVCLVMPFEQVGARDFESKKARAIVKKVLTCIPIIMEKGLFLIYYGNKDKWGDLSPKFTVDKTGFRTVILQSIQFIDPESGETINSRTHWGPLRFGFCGKLIKDIDSLGEHIQEGSACE